MARKKYLFASDRRSLADLVVMQRGEVVYEGDHFVWSRGLDRDEFDERCSDRDTREHIHPAARENVLRVLDGRRTLPPQGPCEHRLNRHIARILER